ncbi:conserved hypothetical protein [Methanosalsum zhilinae DSM 4017]|uniref:Uncharacterized protein n=1 Tax=Methanosalsum zhilinae (strain DSM 4017 / NBRC 107636 / OCM 62 / WeN5) TaxID=679901 RepID=F7XQ88_METZD|nr:hypothetical protein [Methanosalsum zhilinae]AEH61550.1 conserved hypothetical protein [Methanosalsum zhilinae DSM 4017]
MNKKIDTISDQITVDPEIKSYILQKKKDYRVCTTCSGPLVLPVNIKPQKPSDIIIDLGGQKLYVSRVQAQRVRNIDMSMMCSCTFQEQNP